MERRSAPETAQRGPQYCLGPARRQMNRPEVVQPFIAPALAGEGRWPPGQGRPWAAVIPGVWGRPWLRLSAPVRFFGRPTVPLSRSRRPTSPTHEGWLASLGAAGARHLAPHLHRLIPRWCGSSPVRLATEATASTHLRCEASGLPQGKTSCGGVWQLSRQASGTHRMGPGTRYSGEIKPRQQWSLKRALRGLLWRFQRVRGCEA